MESSILISCFCFLTNFSDDILYCCFSSLKQQMAVWNPYSALPPASYLVSHSIYYYSIIICYLLVQVALKNDFSYFVYNLHTSVLLIWPLWVNSVHSLITDFLGYCLKTIQTFAIYIHSNVFPYPLFAMLVAKHLKWVV